MPEQKKQNQIKRIESAMNTLTHLLEEILTLGQADLVKLQCNRAQMDVVSFCQELVAALQLVAPEQHSLTFSTEGEDRAACLDEKLLWHLLNNLISNAIKYSPNGGVVSLTLYWEKDTICFRVQDQGIGIPTEAQPKLFEPFLRASNVGKIPGTGLGLAIVKQCVELHEGQINVESAVGQGTTFIVRLPICSFAWAFKFYISLF